MFKNSLPKITRARFYELGIALLIFLLYSVVVAHIGKLSMIGLYYISTQWLHGQVFLGIHWDVKYIWDHLLTHGGVLPLLSIKQWDIDRHKLRAAGEGLMALVLIHQITFNPKRYKAKSQPGKFYLTLMRIPFVRSFMNWSFIPSRYKPVTTWQEIALPFIVLFVGTVIAIPMFLWGLPLIHSILHAGWLEGQVSTHPSIAEKLYSNMDAFAIGFIAGFIVRFITAPVMNANMKYFCRLCIAHGINPGKWMPRGMRNTIAAEIHEAAVEQSRNTRWFGVYIFTAASVVFSLAIYGAYIIVYVA